MKRYLSLLLIVALLPALLAVPARADDLYETHWVNILDYGYPVGQESNHRDIVSDGSTRAKYYFNYPIPAGTIRAYAQDIIIRTDSTSFIVANNNVYLTVTSLGDGVYRCYGSSHEEMANANLFYVDTASGSYIEVLSFNILVLPCYSYEKVVSGIVYDYSSEPARQSPIVYNGDGVASNTVTLFSQNNQNGKFRAEIDVYQWQSMDYIQLSLSTFCSAVDSIQVQLNAVNVPFEVNYVYVNKASDTGLALIELVIDVRNLNRGSTLDLRVQVTGAVQAPREGNFIIQRCLGVVEVETPSFITYWFTQLKVWLSDQTTALTSGFSGIVNSISTWGQNLMDSINALPDKIAEALQGLFVPSDSAVQDMGQQAEDLAQDRFGGVYEGAQIVDDFASQLQPQDAIQILTVPVVNLDILGTSFPLGGWEVDLVPDGTEIIAETCKIIIDIIATLAFINGLKSRLERTLEQ